MQLDTVDLIVPQYKIIIIGQSDCNLQNEPDEITFAVHEIQQHLLTAWIQKNWDHPSYQQLVLVCKLCKPPHVKAAGGGRICLHEL